MLLLHKTLHFFEVFEQFHFVKLLFILKQCQQKLKQHF